MNERDKDRKKKDKEAKGRKGGTGRKNGKWKKCCRGRASKE